MEMFHNVEKTTEKIEDSTAFTDRVLKNGNSEEILTMKKLVCTQLLYLINNTPKPDINFKIEFDTDASKYEDSINKSFGDFLKVVAVPKVICFLFIILRRCACNITVNYRNLYYNYYTEGTRSLFQPVETPVASLHSSFENENLSLPGMSGVLGADAGVIPAIPGTDLLSSLPPLSLPNVDIGSLAGNLAGISVQAINNIASSIQSLQSAPAVSAPQVVPGERSSSRNSYSPAQSDSGISVDNASTGSGSRESAMTLAGLAKLGPVSVNGQGKPYHQG